MPQNEPWSRALSTVLFITAAVLITVFGVLMARVATPLAARTGLGEALAGAPPAVSVEISRRAASRRCSWSCPCSSRRCQRWS